MAEKLIKNIITDTRKNIKYIILSSKKLKREEMLRQIKFFNYDSANIRQTNGSEVTLYAKDL